MAVLDRVWIEPQRISRPDAWYFDVAAIAALRDDGIDLDPQLTVVVGENGSGKSTFVEAVAAGWRSGLRSAVEHWGPRPGSEDTDLQWSLTLSGEFPRPSGGCFLRAEAMHGLFTAVDATGYGERAFGGALNGRSHGESFLAYLESRETERGLFILDEPEAALSFTSCLRLMSVLDGVIANGSQVLLATHSPVLAAYPNAKILEFSESGIRQREWVDLDLVQHWQAFLSEPGMYLRYLFED